MKSQRNYEPKPLFLERMKSLLPDEKDFKAYLEILKKEPVRSFRCNTLKISPKQLKKRLEKKGWKIKVPFRSYQEIMIVEGKKDNKIAREDNDNPKKITDDDNINSKKIRSNKIKDADDNNNSKTTDSKKIKDINGKNDNINDITSGSSIAQGGRSQGRFIGALIPLEPGEMGRSLEHQLGYYYIQEIASMLPVLVLDPKPEERILDLCASPGSKTTQMGARMENTGLIIANEISFGRTKILSSNLGRCGVSNTIITKKEGIALCNRFNKENFKFDKILVDAPCSGEGTIRGSRKTLKMWNINTVKKLAGIQKRLLSSALEILKSGGEIVYSTCTHSPEENEEVLDSILNSEKFKGKIKIQKVSIPLKSRSGILKWKEKKYLEDVKMSCRIYPHDSNTEGFFISKLKKIYL